MEYIYDGISNELIEKLKTNKLSKAEEQILKYKFLKVNNISSLNCLNNKEDKDEYTLELRKKFSINFIIVVFLTLVLIGIIFFSVIGYANFVADGLSTVEKVMLALILLFFHVVILFDIIVIFNMQIILDKNIFNKIKKY